MSLLKCKIVSVASKKDSFLANPYNKSKFIDLLATALESDGHEVIRCKGDADTSIVSAVLDRCCEGENVVLLAADTDLLIMLLYFWNDLMGHVIMKSEGTKRHKTIERNIGEMAQCLEDVRGFLTIAHAFTGCDATSAIFDQGKASIIKLFEKSPEARKIAGTFLKTDATQDEVGEAGLKLFVLLYGGKSSDTLSSLRFAKYLKMTSVSSALKPEKLPPSERAAWFHSHRVYFQVQEWNSLMESRLDPLDWGWILDGESLTPVKADQVAAPDELVNVIRCNCKLTSKHTCGGKQCSCRKTMDFFVLLFVATVVEWTVKTAKTWTLKMQVPLMEMSRNMAISSTIFLEISYLLLIEFWF